MEKGKEEVDQILGKQQRELGSFPPNWEKARIHGLANSVTRTLNMAFDPSSEDKICPCCLMAVPEPEDKFGICSSNEELGEIGSLGFPLFFELNKCLGLMFLILSIIYFIPIAGLMYYKYSEI